MSNGMMSIGESYMAKQWDVSTTASIDSIVLSLLTLPIGARRRLFQSWEARIVSLLARIFHFAPSCQSNLVGHIERQFHLGNEFYATFLDSSYHHGYACFPIDTTHEELGEGLEVAQQGKLSSLKTLLLTDGDSTSLITVLDISKHTFGGTAVYLAQQGGFHVTSIVSSEREKCVAEEKAAKMGVQGSVTFIVALSIEVFMELMMFNFLNNINIDFLGPPSECTL